MTANPANPTPANPLYTRLCEEYGCEYPIVAFSHTRDVVVAASNAGAIGMLGCSTHSMDELRADLQWIKERVGDRPFGCDITLPSSYVQGNREQLDEQIPEGHRAFVEDLIRDHAIPEPKTPGPWGTQRLRSLADTRAKLELFMNERIPIFASGMGSPAFVLDELHDAGVKVWGLVGLARQAARELESGLDLIIAQGQDSGGHTGRIGTFSIVPEVAELARAYDTPILAAGGVTTGRHLVAALSLGAVGVWTGTLWLATHENGHLESWQKQKVVDARTQDAWVTTAMDGKRARGLRDSFVEAWEQPEAPAPLAMPLQGLLVGKLLQAAEDWDRRDWIRTPGGQGVGFVREIKPTRQVIFDVMEEAWDALDAVQLAEPPGA